MSLRAREQEFLNIVEHLGNDFTIAKNYQKDDMYNESCIGNPEQLALTEIAPKFDAANVIRANDHLLYLVSNSGNRKGAEYLQDFVGADVKVHTLEKVYSYMHIDSTVAFLREGLLLANPSRIKHKDMLPAPFNKWDIVWAPEPVDIGHYPGLCNSSIWTWNVNLFSINPNLVVLEKHQEPTRKVLEAHGIECAMLPIRHARTLGGCFHCCTLDLVREVG
jgi:N-dimethylarginine dimethylaminohydrolase